MLESRLTKRAVTGAVIAAFMLGAGVAQAVGVPGQGTWETTLQPRDIDGDSVTDAFYDTVLDITWLRNANVNGQMTVGTARSWAQDFNFAGYYGWRLPTWDGWGGEMAHLWYIGLGNTAGGPMTNTGNFQNLQSDSYWLDSPQGLTTRYSFSTIDGSQNVHRRGLGIISFYAMAVRPGDVADVIPEPQTYAMLLLGLAGVMVAVRRRAG